MSFSALRTQALLHTIEAATMKLLERKSKKQSSATTTTTTISSTSIPCSELSADTKVLSSASLSIDIEDIKPALCAPNDSPRNSVDTSASTVISGVLESRIRAAVNCLGSGTSDPAIKFYCRDGLATLSTEKDLMEMATAFQAPMKETGAGKSGSAMFWSENRRYIAKTLGSIEVGHTKRLLPEYVEYCRANPGTLLANYVAMFRVRHRRGHCYVVVMENVCSGVSGQLYDLKGSLAGRRARCGESVLKDKDFLRNEEKIKSGDAARFLAALEKDAAFLAQVGSMDYSLLWAARGDSFAGGIIDILTPFAARKRVERLFVGAAKGRARISCAPPAAYAARFVAFLSAATV